MLYIRHLAEFGFVHIPDGDMPPAMVQTILTRWPNAVFNHEFFATRVSLPL